MKLNKKLLLILIPFLMCSCAINDNNSNIDNEEPPVVEPGDDPDTPVNPGDEPDTPDNPGEDPDTPVEPDEPDIDVIPEGALTVDPTSPDDKESQGPISQDVENPNKFHFYSNGLSTGTRMYYKKFIPETNNPYTKLVVKITPSFERSTGELFIGVYSSSIHTVFNYFAFNNDYDQPVKTRAEKKTSDGLPGEEITTKLCTVTDLEGENYTSYYNQAYIVTIDLTKYVFNQLVSMHVGAFNQEMDLIIDYIYLI